MATIAETSAGAPRFSAWRAAERSQQLEQVGAQLRALMPFLDAVERCNLEIPSRCESRRAPSVDARGSFPSNYPADGC